MGFANDLERLMENEIETRVEKAIDAIDIDSTIQEAVDNYDWSDVITSELIENNVDLDSIVCDSVDEKVDSKVNQLLDSTPICDILSKLDALEKENANLNFSVRMLTARVENLENRESIRSKSGLFSRIRQLFTGK